VLLGVSEVVAARPLEAAMCVCVCVCVCLCALLGGVCVSVCVWCVCVGRTLANNCLMCDG